MLGGGISGSGWDGFVDQSQIVVLIIVRQKASGASPREINFGLSDSQSYRVHDLIVEQFCIDNKV